MKKFLAVLLVLALSLSLLAACGQTTEGPSQPLESTPAETQPEPEYTPSAEPSSEPEPEPEPEPSEVPADVPLMEVSAAPGDEGYYKELYEVELCNYKVIRSLPTTYEETSWNAYWKLAGRLESMDVNALTEENIEVIEEAVVKRSELKQIKPYADSAWFIWGDEMACSDGEVLDYQYSSTDFEGFKPFLVPYLLEDQSEVKGILIAIAGGGYSQRNNTIEGYPIAEAFNEYGYNCFVLQRRVEPSTPEDSWMDLQRAIRYIRYYAEERGIAGTDCIMAAGFSGGAGTISGTVSKLYGDAQPTIYDSDYTPDEIDAMNADLDVVFLSYGNIYDLSEIDDGSFDGWHTDNPNLPGIFIAAGYEDRLVDPDFCIALANEMQDRTEVELHLFAFIGHGFSTGIVGTSSVYWIPMADAFATRVTIQRSK